MKISTFSDQHWTDEQLIAGLYGVGPDNGHLGRCERCKSRRESLVNARRMHEAARSNHGDVSSEFLSAQRRAIYSKIEARGSWPALLTSRRWAPVALAFLLLISGAAVYEQHRAQQLKETQLSDTQLAFEVSEISQDLQAESTAPLQGLFE